MDLSEIGTNKDKNKRRVVSSDDDQPLPQLQDEPNSKRNCPSFPSGFETGFATIVKHLFAEFRPQIEPLIGQVVVERFCAEIWPQIELSFRQKVREDIECMVQSHIHSLLPSLRKTDEIEKGFTSSGSGSSGTLKLKLCFCNPIESIIFTNNEIKSENGEPLKVAICDVTKFNAIISTGPLASALIEFFIIDGEFYETYSDFNQSTVKPRKEKPPLIIGKDLKLYLQNGVGIVKNLSITDNSSWMKSKMFCLGAKLTDDKSLVQFPRIQEAVSQPFRVLDQRGEVYKKHRQLSREDEVWRLKGIAKDGIYHTNLSSKGINTVGDFLKAYREKGPTTLKTMLGKRVLNKTWNVMVKNAEECVDVPTNYDQSFQANNLVENKEEVKSNENFEVQEQNQSFEANNLVENKEEAKSNENFEVHEKNQSSEANDLVEINKGKAYSNENFQVYNGQKEFGDNDELPRTRSFEDLLSIINFEVTDPPSPLFPHGEVSTSYAVGYTGTHTQYYQGLGPS